MKDNGMELQSEAAAAMERSAQAEALAAKIDAFGASLARKRDEAVSGRSASGIESEWSKAEDAYHGIDDANRHTVAAHHGKPSSASGGYINEPIRGGAGRSTVFLNITRPYVDAAAAKVGDMLLPTDDSPWGVRATPLPMDMQALLRPAGMEAGQAGQAPMDGALEQQIAAAKDAASMVEARAKAAAEGAQEQIEDWLTECQWHGEVRKLIEDCARLGTGVLKGPYPVKRSSRVNLMQDGVLVKVLTEHIAPASKCVSPWKIYPDPACGESIQDGAYVWEVDSITARGLRDLKGVPGYIDSQIDKAIEQDAGGKQWSAKHLLGREKARDGDQFEIWYFYGFAEREDLLAAGVEVPEGAAVAVPAIVTMVNDCVIKAALNPMDTGEFPYDFMPWQRKTGQPWGAGVAEQINTPQRMLNAATRNMMDNAGFSAGPQIVVRRDAITPADGTWQMTPRKFWFVNEGADVNAVAQAFMAVNIPTMQAELMHIIQFALKMAEDVTGLPMLMQGQQGQAPDTVGGMQMMLANASVVLRRIARQFDDRVIEPHIRRYYDWLMEYGENDEIKGDVQIDARGSSVLVERDIQATAIMQMANLVGNPAFGIDPQKWVQEAMKAQRIDPKRLLMDEQQRAAMTSQPPPVAPAVEVARIRAEADLQKAQMQGQIEQALAQMRAQNDLQIAQMREQVGLQKIAVDTDRDNVFAQAQVNRDQVTAQAKFAELQLRREIEVLKLAQQKDMALDEIKAMLAKEAMQINSVRELAGMRATAEHLPRPPIEPAGRAPDGESFQR